MLMPPMEVVMKWPKPNYENPERQGNILIPLTAAMIAITVIVVSLRLYVRAFILHAFKSDDWLIIAATIASIGVSITCMLSEADGVGYHVWDLKLDQISRIRRWSFSTQVAFTFAVSLTKFSILLFYLRFATTRRFKIWIYGTMAFVVCWTITWTFMVIFQCIPVQSYWMPTQPGDFCLTVQNEMHLLHGASNLFSDILVLALPIPTVWKLQMPMRQKWTLIGVLTLGIVAPLAAILRLVYIERATTSWDASWWCVELWIFTSLETHVAIVCASIPSLKPLVIRVFPRFGSSGGFGYSDSGPMAFNNSGSGGSGIHHRNGSNGARSDSRAGGSSRAAKIRSVYPLSSIITMEDAERGESQESIVGKTTMNGLGADDRDIITRVQRVSETPTPPPGSVMKTTEISWESSSRKANRPRYDMNV